MRHCPGPPVSALLARLPSDPDLDRLALKTKAIQRKRQSVDVRALWIALARGPGGLSLRQTSAWASMLGIVELSDPAVKYRLNQATDFLAALVERLLAAKAPGAELRSAWSNLAPRRRHLREQTRQRRQRTGVSTACSISDAAGSRISN